MIMAGLHLSERCWGDGAAHTARPACVVAVRSRVCRRLGVRFRVSEKGGGGLFIVDNSVSGWTGLEYLRQWCDLARSFDIAAGFFEIGALLALDGRWQQLEGMRLLMGDEVSLCTRAAFSEALRRRVARLDDSLEAEKGPNPFLEGVEAVVEAIADRRSSDGCTGVTSSTPRRTSPTRSRRGGSAGAGRVEQFHPAGPDPQRGAEHPGAERPARREGSASASGLGHA